MKRSCVPVWCCSQSSSDTSDHLQEIQQSDISSPGRYSSAIKTSPSASECWRFCWNPRAWLYRFQRITAKALSQSTTWTADIRQNTDPARETECGTDLRVTYGTTRKGRERTGLIPEVKIACCWSDHWPMPVDRVNVKGDLWWREDTVTLMLLKPLDAKFGLSHILYADTHTHTHA